MNHSIIKSVHGWIPSLNCQRANTTLSPTPTRTGDNGSRLYFNRSEGSSNSQLQSVGHSRAPGCMNVNKASSNRGPWECGGDCFENRLNSKFDHERPIKIRFWRQVWSSSVSRRPKHRTIRSGGGGPAGWTSVTIFPSDDVCLFASPPSSKRFVIGRECALSPLGAVAGARKRENFINGDPWWLVFFCCCLGFLCFYKAKTAHQLFAGVWNVCLATFSSKTRAGIPTGAPRCHDFDMICSTGWSISRVVGEGKDCD